MKLDHPRLIYGAIVAAALLAIIAALYEGRLELKDVGTGLVALLGTVVGATLAFRLNADREYQREQVAQRAALNRALFTIARQWNALRLLAREAEPYKTLFDRAFNMPAMKPPPYSDLAHSFEELDFLLITGSDVNVLFRLSVEQERFHQVVAALETRNEFYVRDLQPEMARLKLNGRSVALEDAHTLLGERLFGTAIHSAESFWRHLQESLISLRAMHDEVRGVAKRLYPKHGFVAFNDAA
jgi:hypothetical protein